MDTATDIPFDESSAKFLAQFRYAAAGFLKTLILARKKQDSDFVTGEMRERWVLDEFGTEKRSCEFLLGVALERRLVFLKKYVGYRDSIPCPETEEEERLETLRENVATFVSAAELDRAIEAVRRSDSVDWDRLARWELLPAIRAGLDELPEKGTLAHQDSRQGKAPTPQPSEAPIYTKSMTKTELGTWFGMHRNKVRENVLDTLVHPYRTVGEGQGERYRIDLRDMPPAYHRSVEG